MIGDLLVPPFIRKNTKRLCNAMIKSWKIEDVLSVLGEVIRELKNKSSLTLCIKNYYK